MHQKSIVFYCTLLLFLFLLPCCLHAQWAGTASPPGRIVTARVDDILMAPEVLLNWTGPAPEAALYSKEAIEAQRDINENFSDAVVTFQMETDSSDWTEIDFEPITPFTWKWIDFKLVKEDGTRTQISLRRPNWWIEREGAEQVGNKILLSLPEMSIHGYATVSAVRVNQLDTRFWNNDLDDGYVLQPVTGKFIHQSSNVIDLYFDGQAKPVGVTSSHPFWSIDRNDWVEASDLRPGEAVKTYAGIAQLDKSRPVEGTHVVYNLEIYRNHNYHVTDMGMLVHNHCLDKKPFSHIVRQSRLPLHTKIYDLLKVKPGQGYVNREKIKEIFDHMLNNKNFWKEMAKKNTPIIIHRFTDGKMIVKEGHHRFLALSAASRIEGYKMPDLTDSRIFLIKDFNKPSAGQVEFEWDKLVEMNVKDVGK